MTAIADAACRSAFAEWDPTRPPPTHREFAPRTRLPGGPLKGTPYDPSTDPVQSWIIDQLDSGRRRRLYWSAPPQIGGKTQCAVIVPAMRAAICLKASVGYGLPTLQDLDRGWQTKVAPTIRDAGLGDYLPQSGPGSRGGRPPSVTFEDPDADRAPLGSFIFLAGGAKQVTCQVIVVDEIDAWRTAEGEPRWSDLEDVWSRADSFQGAAIRIGVGTVEVDDPARSIVLALVNEHGTGHRMHARCPHCGTYAPNEWGCWSYEYRVIEGGTGADTSHAAATAAYACPACGVRWTEDDRRQALLAAKFAAKGQTVDAAGVVQGPEPTTDALGLRTHALDSILTTMAEIAKKHALARYALERHNNHEPMRKFWRYQRVEGYLGDKQADEDTTRPLTHQTLAELSKRTAWSEVFENKDEGGLWSRYCAALPPEADFGVGEIDVQHNRLYHGSIGVAADERTWDTSWGTDYAHAGTERQQPAPFGPGEFTATADRVADWMEQVWGDKFRIGVIDTGDQAAPFAAEIDAWLRRRPKWRACRGVDILPRIKQDGSEQACEARVDGLVCWEKVWRPSLGRYLISSEGSWRSFQAAYRREPGKPGAAALPGPLKPGNFYLRHVTAKGEITTKGGATVFKEQPGGGRHDLGDCRGYGQAVALALLRYKDKPKPATPAIAGFNDPFMRRLR